MRRKKLDPRFKREGDGTLKSDIKVRPRSKKYAEKYDRIIWAEPVNSMDIITPENIQSRRS